MRGGHVLLHTRAAWRLEGSYALLLQAMGLPAAAGVTIVLVRRARSLVIGGLGFLLFAGGRPRQVRDEITPAPKC